MSSDPTELQPHADISGMPGIAINGKFLQPSTSRSGVYRVAREMLVALDRVLADNPALAAAMPCRLLIPGGLPPALAAELRLKRIVVPVRQGEATLSPAMQRLYGLLWEQFALPWRARGATLLNLCNIGPVVYRNAFTMVHDAQVYSAPDSYSRGFRTWYRLVLPLLGKGNRGLLTVSQYSRKQLAHFGVAPAGRIRVVHNGCDHVLRLRPDKTQVEALGLTGRPFVLALANAQPHKNIAVLLKAFGTPLLQGATLALFGPARREDFEAQGHTVPANVRFLGFVSDETMAGLLHQASALAFPSTTEGFGLPPLEGMLLGCPAVVAPNGALPEVCGDAVLWAHPHDVNEWSRQIYRLCSDAKLRAQMQERGKAHAAHFAWHRAACRLLEAVLGHSLADTGLMRPQGDAGAMRAPAPSADWLGQREPQGEPAFRSGMS